MSIEKPPFVRQTLGDEPAADTFAIRLNNEERAWLEKGKRLLEQPKDSTALKQLAEIGLIVIQAPETSSILGVVFKNKRCNKRLGIIEYGQM